MPLGRFCAHTGRDEPVPAPEDTDCALQGFVKCCSKNFPITYFSTAITFSISLQSSLRKLRGMIPWDATQPARRGKTPFKLSKASLVFICVTFSCLLRRLVAPKESLFFHLSTGILKKANCLQQICSLSDMNITTKKDKIS